jgi:mono/diheme cytochrome c family protein
VSTDNDQESTGLAGGIVLAAIGGLFSFTLVVVVGAAILAAAFGPSGGSGDDVADSATSSDVELGAKVFANSCASCHGSEGEGGVGPAFAGIVVRYPEVADHTKVVAEGQGQMPAFGGTLSAAEIDAVVAYERDVLGEG